MPLNSHQNIIILKFAYRSHYIKRTGDHEYEYEYFVNTVQYDK